MKKVQGFWASLERYLWKAVGQSPLPYTWVGVAVVMIVLVASMIGDGASVVGATSLKAVVEKAARLGDYGLARELWSESMGELEDIVYPERKVERRIEELTQKLEEYPGNRQIYLGLSELYGQLGNREKSEEYREKARVLDPSN
jgi:tetratricopeptide (TPR) repeat protein